MCRPVHHPVVAVELFANINIEDARLEGLLLACSSVSLAFSQHFSGRWLLAAASRLIRPCSCLAFSLALGFPFQAVLLFFSTRSSNIVKTFLSLPRMPQSRKLLTSRRRSAQTPEFFIR